MALAGCLRASVISLVVVSAWRMRSCHPAECQALNSARLRLAKFPFFEAEAGVLPKWC